MAKGGNVTDLIIGIIALALGILLTVTGFRGMKRSGYDMAWYWWLLVIIIAAWIVYTS